MKAWERGKHKNSQGRFSRRVAIRDERPRILIVCEGEKTEPNYFNGFHLANVNLQIVPAKAQHLSVVEYARQLLEVDNDYEEIWCVFDRDKHVSNPKDLQTFNEALALAKRLKIKVAYSNDAFELWYLLHFNYYDTAISRADYITKLKDIMGDYKKNDPKIFDKLEKNMGIAIKNAKRLYFLSDKNDPGNADPTTTVYKLVERLRKIG